jgi:hypothetical protein
MVKHNFGRFIYCNNGVDSIWFYQALANFLRIFSPRRINPNLLNRLVCLAME